MPLALRPSRASHGALVPIADAAGRIAQPRTEWRQARRCRLPPLARLKNRSIFSKRFGAGGRVYSVAEEGQPRAGLLNPAVRPALLFGSTPSSRRITTSLSVNDTGGTASSARTARAPRRITCLRKSTLGQSACQVACRIWTLISTHILATTATGSMPGMRYRCRCCRRASST